jgi:CubicO group peptidase (beta-lactamase class C family)
MHWDGEKTFDHLHAPSPDPLGWENKTLPNGEEMVWHNGRTAGYRAFIGFSQRLKLGVIVLTNSRDKNIDAIGRNVLRVLQK